MKRFANYNEKIQNTKFRKYRKFYQFIIKIFVQINSRTLIRLSQYCFIFRGFVLKLSQQNWSQLSYFHQQIIFKYSIQEHIALQKFQTNKMYEFIFRYLSLQSIIKLLLTLRLIFRANRVSSQRSSSSHSRPLRRAA